MRPFLLLTTREHERAAAQEHQSVMRFAGLDATQLTQFRLDLEPLPEIDLDDYSGVILGGSGYCVSDAEKSDTQRRVESDIFALLDRIVPRDFPFLGLCYGVGVLASYLGGVVDHRYSEDVGAIPITLTAAGRADPLLDGVPEVFHAFVGHKEAANGLPPDATLLASGAACPAQLFRVGRNAYATQFHPELDAEALITRMRVYQHDGYFRPEDLDALAAAARASAVDGSQHLLLSNFVRLHARD